MVFSRWIPEDILAFSPTLRNITENPTTVQFNHRILGTSTLALVSLVALRSRSLPLPPRYLLPTPHLGSLGLSLTLSVQGEDSSPGPGTDGLAPGRVSSPCPPPGLLPR